MLYSSLLKAKNSAPERCAVSCDGQRMSYTELVRAVDYAADRLGEQGIGTGEAVGLVLNNSLEFVICLYALSSRHVSVVLINPQNDVQKIRENLLAIQLDTVIMENHLFDSLLRIEASFSFRLLLRKDLPQFCFPGEASSIGGKLRTINYEATKIQLSSNVPPGRQGCPRWLSARIGICWRTRTTSSQPSPIQGRISSIVQSQYAMDMG